MEKINHSQMINIKYQEPFFHASLNTKKTLINNEKQILFNHKSSLETLLNIIKNSQLEYLSKDKNKNTKQMLKILKENLNLMLKEKNKKINYIKNKNEIIKNKLQNVLFPDSNDSTHIGYNNKIINNNISYNSFSEINQLQLLNFQIQNEIDKTKFLIEQKLQYHSLVKSIPFFFHLYYNNNLQTNKKVTKYLKEIIREVRNEFIKVVKEKMNKEFEINGLIFNINYLKDNIDSYKINSYKKYINSEDIIQEESREYTKSMITTQSKRNSISNINNKNLMKNKSNININGSNTNYNNNNKKKRIIKDKLQNNSIFYTHKINKDILTDNNKTSIKNYLNMNINVNINLNNNNNFIEGSFNSSLDSSETDEENEKNEQYEMDINDKNKIIITPIITTDNYNHQNNINNSLTSDSDSIDNNNSFILDIKDN